MSVMLVNGDAFHIPLADKSVHCVVTSPPYWSLRNYECEGQIGTEDTPEQYVENLVTIFREVRRVLRDDGTLWLNLGDSYAGSGGAGGDYNKGGLREGQPRYEGTHSKMRRAARGGKGPAASSIKPKDLVGIPWMVAFALRADGWYLRSDVIWAKTNSMPGSAKDRPSRSHEYLFLLTKNPRYYYDSTAIKEPLAASSLKDKRLGTGKNVAKKSKYFNNGDSGGAPPGLSGMYDVRMFVDPEAGRNKRTVWNIAVARYSGAHFATFPPALVEPCIKAGTSEYGCCPVCGNGWVRELGKASLVGYGREGSKTADHVGLSPTSSIRTKHWKVFETVGWNPTCEHGFEPVPCIVFDPFGGAATTALVARRLGRRAVVMDLSFEYMRLSQGRLAADKVSRGKRKARRDDAVEQLPLLSAVDEPVCVEVMSV